MRSVESGKATWALTLAFGTEPSRVANTSGVVAADSKLFRAGIDFIAVIFTPGRVTGRRTRGIHVYPPDHARVVATDAVVRYLKARLQPRTKATRALASSSDFVHTYWCKASVTGVESGARARLESPPARARRRMIWMVKIAFEAQLCFLAPATI